MDHPISAHPYLFLHRHVALSVLAIVGTCAQADGLVLHAAADPLRPQPTKAHAHAAATSAIHPLGAYYFSDVASRDEPGTTWGSAVGSLHASTGVTGPGQPRHTMDIKPDASLNQPYLALGYSHLWLRSQLSLNADFGLASQNVGAVSHFRGLLNGSQSFEQITRDLRWAPVMAVNVDYSF